MTYKTFKIMALGCRANQYEAQAISDQLKAIGCSEAHSNEPADLCIVNSCTVTDGADRKCRALIRQLAKKNSGSTIVVTGCMAERIPDLAQKIPEIDHIVPNSQKERLVSILFPEIEKLPEFAITAFEGHTRAFVKIQDGCNSFCTYCIIPYVRGRSRSRKMADIVSEVEMLVGNGYKEVVLTGINIGDYDGGDGGVVLADLIRALDTIPELERLRLSSIDPDDIDDTLFDAIMKCRTTCHSLHLVLQSGSNRILKKMNRKYTRNDYLDVVERFRHADPLFTFTTDIIVGFPGETSEDFADTLRMVDDVQFVHTHLFPYSDRPGTAASRYGDKVTGETMKSRKELLTHHAKRAAYGARECAVGMETKILVEGDGTLGHTDTFLPVMLSRKEEPNSIITVFLEENGAERLKGTRKG